MSFNLPYVFRADGREVVIQHKSPHEKFEKYLRVKPGSLEEPDHEGGQGPFARWKVHLEGGDKCRLESLKNPGKFLRIKAGGDDVDVGGGKGPFTLFKIIGDGNIVKLESNKFDGKYLAVQPKGVAVGVGGKWCALKFLREGGGGGGDFDKKYMFKKTNIVVIKHHKGKFLRVKPGDTDDLDEDGGKGALAQWEADPQDGGDKVRFMSLKSGKYLRIHNNEINVGGGGGKYTVFKVHKDGDHVKLESVEYPGKYIAVQPKGINIGGGGQFTKLEIFRQ